MEIQRAPAGIIIDHLQTVMAVVLKVNPVAVLILDPYQFAGLLESASVETIAAPVEPVPDIFWTFQVYMRTLMKDASILVGRLPVEVDPAAGGIRDFQKGLPLYRYGRLDGGPVGVRPTISHDSPGVAAAVIHSGKGQTAPAWGDANRGSVLISRLLPLVIRTGPPINPPPPWLSSV